MTPDELLTRCRQTGIVLEAHGDQLHVEAPAGVMTPTLREELARHKPGLLARLRPVEFVSLKGGIVVPVPAWLLALDLERRGFKMSLDPCRQFQIEPTAALTEADQAALRHWRVHLGAVVGYDSEGGETPS